jgi:hypothetical protein
MILPEVPRPQACTVENDILRKATHFRTVQKLPLQEWHPGGAQSLCSLARNIGGSTKTTSHTHTLAT